MFTIIRFHYTEVLFHNVLLSLGRKEWFVIIEDFVIEVRYIKVLLYQVYKLLTICLPQDELFLHGKQLMSLSLDLLSTVT